VQQSKLGTYIFNVLVRGSRDELHQMVRVQYHLCKFKFSTDEGYRTGSRKVLLL